MIHSPEFGARFWSKVQKVDCGGCWMWVGAATRQGYGQINVQGRMAYAHRVSYEMAVGPIPVGLQIDHLCRNRRCVNPDHLEPVTRRENILRGDGITARNARKTHCAKGHSFAGDNLYVYPDGNRGCRICDRAAGRMYHRRRRTAILEARKEARRV